MNASLSNFTFIFLIYAVVTSGRINELLSCQMQVFIEESKYFRHVLGILLVFVFIMLEGGWNSAQEDSTDTSWNNSDAIITLLFSVLVYIVFLISSKSRLVPNLIFFTLTFIIYMINTQYRYYKMKKKVSNKYDKIVSTILSILIVAAISVLVYGFIDYIIYQRNSYGNKFDWSKFILGESVCKSFNR